MNALMIVTSHGQLGDTGRPTGLWLEELAVPYYEFSGNALDVDIASPRGGEAPIDPRSIDEAPERVKAFLYDDNAMAKVKATQSIEKLLEDGAVYDAYFVVGGHGIV